MAAPSTRKALKSISAGKAEVQDVPVPGLRPDRVLVKINHVALNPTDWKHIDCLPSPGSTVGCDFAGTVLELGCAVDDRFQKGDRVAGLTHGTNILDTEDGAFAEYAVVKPNILIKIPQNVKDEEAAGLGVAVLTNGLCLYQRIHLPMPGSVPAGFPILIYGGSSATGSIAIQPAKLPGAKVISTASPRNFEYLKSLGSDVTLDYNDPDVVKKIKAATNDRLHHLLDCVGGDATARICAASLSPEGGQLCSIIPDQAYPRDDIRTDLVLSYSAIGARVRILGEDLPFVIEEHDLALVYFQLAERLLVDGTLEPHRFRVGEGLEGVMKGLDEMRHGKVSGTKLVYRL